MQIELLEGKLEQPGFWDNVAESQAVMKELKNLKDTIEEFEDIKTQYEARGPVSTQQMSL